MEIFKDIPEWEWLYQASNLWNIKSMNYRRSWKETILKYAKNRYWYNHTNLSRNWISKTFVIHRLIALTFVPNLENKPQVNHINWIKADNKSENLEWCTASENVRHRFDVLGHKSYNKWQFWKDCVHSKKVNQYTKDWVFIKTWGAIIDVEIELCIHNTSITNCCKWRLKSAGWFKWEYFIF